MCKKLIYLHSFIVILALAGNASADLVAHWKFDNDLTDSVGSLTWTANGGAGFSTDAQEGSHSLSLDGVNDYLSQDAVGPLLVEFSTQTVTLWFKADSTAGTGVMYDEGGTTRGMTIRVNSGNLEAAIRDNSTQATVSTSASAAVWIHVAVSFDNGLLKLYADGIEKSSITAGFTSATQHSNVAGLGARNSQDSFGGTATGDYFGGLIDDVRIYDHVLSVAEIAGLIKGFPKASGPIPSDGGIHEDTWVSLSWKPGDFAVSHDVYMGESQDDVNEATRDSDVFRGNQMTDFYIAGFPGFAYPEGLVPGTTYYWRIDEVNDADPNSPWKGDVWSFTVPSLIAYTPDPADETEYVNPDEVTLSWAPGFGAKLHYVYFGDNFDDVSNATVGLPQADAIYTPTGLEMDKTYYWRVDEFDGFTTHKGDVWSFTTRPVIPITDPELLCWWKLDEGQGTTVLDWSGHGCDASFSGNPLWVDGYDGGALNFDGAGQNVTYLFNNETWSAYTLAVWAKADELWQSNNSSLCATYLTTAGGFQFSFDATNNYQYHADVDQIIGPASLSWVHLAVTYDGTTATAYYNGDFVATFTPAADDLLANKYAIGINRAEDNWFDGSVDDFRVYSRALSQEEIQYIMRGDPMVAWRPSPADGSNPDVDVALPLSWSVGDNASQHDVYFSIDEVSVNDANSSDTTGVYRGRQNATNYTPPEGVEWGGGPYYWRIDEVNTDGTISKGRIWSFSVADFILVEDFESYTDDDLNGEAIWQHWIDGFGVPGNGAQVGYLLPPYAEQNIVNNGNQSMPFLYDNTAGVTNSEAVLTLTSPRNWNREGLSNLSLWFRGNPASVGSFVEAPAGTYTMTASGADIWNTADEFHYAYKTLTGAGSIVARVNSVQNTNAWAKAGVMIRETLDAGSKHAFACITPGNGVAAQGRTTTDGSSYSTNETGITAPYWVKLERDAAGNFTVSHSTNGTTWQSVASAVPQNTPMTSNVYIGLALTSHDAALTCQAVFSNVTTTGNVSGQWAHQDVGITTNAAEPMYVELSNANGASAVVAHDDPVAATIDVWTEWVIPLQAFADQGINLSNVDSIAIGLGTKAGIVTSGGSGTVYFDDIRLYPPTPEPEPQS